MNIILVVLAVALVAFTLEMIDLFKQYGMVPDTLVQCVFVAVTGECGFMGWIKTNKEKYRDRKWQKEDMREANMAAQMPAVDRPLWERRRSESMALTGRTTKRRSGAT